MHVITFLNEKGGVGKTTLAVHMAAGLAVAGYRVMLLDADPQGHATVSLNMPKEAGLLNLLVNDWEFSDVLRAPAPEVYNLPDHTLKGRLFLLPADVAVRAIPGAIDDVTLLAQRLEEVEDDIDVVVIDTSPTPSLLHSSIYLATDGILFPTECEYLSIDGLANSINRRQNFDPMRLQINRKPIEVIGIIPNKYERKTILHNEHLKLLLKNFGRSVWTPITKYTSWREASSARRTIWSIGPQTRAAEEGWKMVSRMVERLSTWQNG